MCSINHDLKAVFIHVHKTGGSYIASVLKQYYGFETYYLKRPDHDTFCAPPMRLVDAHGRRVAAKVNSRAKNPKQKNYENRVHGVLVYYKTSPELNSRMGMTPQKWDSYYKFTFLRNPYDRMVSGWNHMNPRIPFSQYVLLKNHVPDMEYIHVFMNQVRHVVNERGQLAVQFIGRFENLEEDFDKVLTNLGIYYRIHNPYQRVNKHDHAHFSTYYDSATLMVVNALIAEDLRAFAGFYSKCERLEDFVVEEKKTDAREYATEVDFDDSPSPGSAATLCTSGAKRVESEAVEGNADATVAVEVEAEVEAEAPANTNSASLADMVMMSHSLDKILMQLDREI